MKHSWLGLIELFVVLLFVAGWGILELVTLRMDRRRAAQQAAGSRLEPAGDPRAATPADGASEESPRHPKR